MANLDDRNHLTNTRIDSLEVLPTAAEMVREIPYTDAAKATVKRGRDDAIAILRGEDNRRMIIAGPCSIHDPDEARAYARELVELQREVRDTHLILMRAYLEKPRTDLGWTGFVTDPHINYTFDVAHGRREARKLLADIAELGMPVVTEVLDRSHIQYYDHLISIATIGARTVEYMNMRHMASGLSMPVGMKNATSGSVKEAIDAMVTTYESHSFVGTRKEDGRETVYHTRGNPLGFLILRGGKTPNYDAGSVEQALGRIDAANAQRDPDRQLVDRLVIDCSHGNSLVTDPGSLLHGKRDYARQVPVAFDVGGQMRTNPRIAGIMLESYFNAGAMTLPKDLSDFDRGSMLLPGTSLTDACIDLRTTRELVRDLHGYALEARR